MNYAGTKYYIFWNKSMNIDLIKIEHILGQDLVTYDPYDLWRTNVGIWLKKTYYRNGKIAFPIVAPFSILDTYAPKLIRIFLKLREYPMVRAFAALSALNLYEITADKKYIEFAEQSIKWLINNKCSGYHGASWGINIPWMTKTGFLPASTPFVTNTPYCVEALLKYSDITKDKQSLQVALSSLGFLEKDLNVLFDEPDKLALSYGPGYGKRIVINANSYAMMMYAIFAGRLSDKRTILLEKAARIFNFIKSRQNSDGSWFYYDDEGKGNFIDCFHSCFILKNLIKFGKFAGVDVSLIVNKGLEYILNNFLDSKYFMARRFSISSDPSLVKFDLYDQAELLNILLMTNRNDLAEKLHDSIVKNFYIPSKGTFGYQIDIFGRLNKMTYLRWAVMPTVFVLSEYYKLLKKER